jgi:hypothetical protein
MLRSAREAVACAMEGLEERRLLAAPADRFEPNDSFALATDFGNVSTRTENGLNVHAAFNDDYFRFVPSAAGQFTASISFTGAGDLDLALYNSSQTLLTVSESSGNFETVSYPLTAGQTYYLKVYGFEGAINDNYGLTIVTAIAPDRFEANDTFATARNFGSVSALIENNLTVHAPGNDDYYRFMPGASGPFTAQISFTNSLGDLDLILYNSSQEEIARADGSEDIEGVVFQALAGQTYFVRVQGYASAISPRYVLYLDQAPGTIAGQAYEDRNASGAKDAGEAGLAGRTVYIDANGNSQLDAGEVSAVSNAVGNYVLTNVRAGTHLVRQVAPGGWLATGPVAGAHTVNLAAGQNATGFNFGSFPTVFEDFAGGDDAYYVRVSPTQPRVQIFVNSSPEGNPNYSILASALPSLTFIAGAGSDVLTVDFENGNPVPALSIIYHGGTQGSGGEDALVVKGTQSLSANYRPSGTVSGSGGVFVVGARMIAFSGVEPVMASNFDSLTVVAANADDVIEVDSPVPGESRVSGSSGGGEFAPLSFFDVGTLILDTASNDGGAGNDAVHVAEGLLAAGLNLLRLNAGTGVNTLVVDGGTLNLDTSLGIGGGNLVVTVNDGADVRFASSQRLGGLNVNDGGRVNLVGEVLRTGALSITGDAALDVGGGAVIVQSSAGGKEAVLESIEEWIRMGRNRGAWDELGISSSAAALDASRNTGLAAIINDRGDGTVVRGELAGESVDTNTILIKWTYNGDSDLSGALDADDYAKIDAAYGSAIAASYYTGDFDYSQRRDGDDYFLIDRAFGGQGEVLAQVVMAAAAEGEVTKVVKPSREQKYRRKQQHHPRKARQAPRWRCERAPGLWG